MHVEVDLQCIFLSMEKSEDALARYYYCVGLHHVMGRLKEMTTWWLHFLHFREKPSVTTCACESNSSSGQCVIVKFFLIWENSRVKNTMVLYAWLFNLTKVVIFKIWATTTCRAASYEVRSRETNYNICVAARICVTYILCSSAHVHKGPFRPSTWSPQFWRTACADNTSARHPV